MGTAGWSGRGRSAGAYKCSNVLRVPWMQPFSPPPHHLLYCASLCLTLGSTTHRYMFGDNVPYYVDANRILKVGRLARSIRMASCRVQGDGGGCLVRNDSGGMLFCRPWACLRCPATTMLASTCLPSMQQRVGATPPMLSPPVSLHGCTWHKGNLSPCTPANHTVLDGRVRTCSLISSWYPTTPVHPSFTLLTDTRE